MMCVYQVVFNKFLISWHYFRISEESFSIQVKIQVLFEQKASVLSQIIHLAWYLFVKTIII